MLERPFPDNRLKRSPLYRLDLKSRENFHLKRVKRLLIHIGDADVRWMASSEPNVRSHDLFAVNKNTCGNDMKLSCVSGNGRRKQNEKQH